MSIVDLQEPRTAADQVWDFVVEGDEANVQHVVLFLNPLTIAAFDVTVYAPNGTKVFYHHGQRGVQTIPALPAGTYRIGVTGSGTFLVTRHYLDTANQEVREDGVLVRKNVTTTDVNRTLQGTEAWLLVPTRPWNVQVEGNVSVQWAPLNLGDPVHAGARLDTPVNRTAEYPIPTLLLVRGAAGTRYSIHLEPAPNAPPTASSAAPPGAATPGPGLALLACAALIAALAWRRARPKT